MELTRLCFDRLKVVWYNQCMWGEFRWEVSPICHPAVLSLPVWAAGNTLAHTSASVTDFIQKDTFWDPLNLFLCFFFSTSVHFSLQFRFEIFAPLDLLPVLLCPHLKASCMTVCTKTRGVEVKPCTGWLRDEICEILGLWACWSKSGASLTLKKSLHTP